VRVRTIELRILGVALAGLWFAAFGLVLFGYRPGGPVDILVGIAAAGPLAVAMVAVAWPPVARGDRVFTAIAWLGLAAILLLVPSLGGLVDQLTGRGPQTLLPSAEAAYPWLLALVATGLFSGLGLARRRLGETTIRRRRLAAGTAAGLAMVFLAGTAFASAAIINELALADRPAIASRFGPTDPALEPPPCDGTLVAGPTARLSLRMDASLDDRYTGQVVVGGVRNGTDVSWNGFAGTRLTLGQRGLTRIAGQVWELAPGRPWTRTDAQRGDGRDLDRQLVLVALTPANRSVAEDRGLAYIDGSRARHCRITVDGVTLREALPEIELFVGQSDISRWRGDLDFWVFADGQLGQADGLVSGPATGIDDDALLAGIRFRLLATDRGQPFSVTPPTR
jgi:hypothetical protein